MRHRADNPFLTWTIELRTPVTGGGTGVLGIVSGSFSTCVASSFPACTDFVCASHHDRGGETILKGVSDALEGAGSIRNLFRWKPVDE